MNITASQVKELRDKTGAGRLDCKKALSECNANIEKAIDYLREKGITKALKKQDRIAAEGLSNIYIDSNKAVIVELNSETDFVAKNDEFKSLLDIIGKSLLESDASSMEEALKLNTKEGTINDLIVNLTAKIGEKLSFRRFNIIKLKEGEIFGSYIHMGGKISSLVVISGEDEEVAKDVAMQAAAMRPKYINIDSIPKEDIEREKNVLTEQVINEGKPKDIAEKIVVGKMNKFYEETVLEEQVFIKDSSFKVKDYLKNNNSSLISLVRYEVGEGLEKRNEDFAEEVMSQLK